MRERRKREIKNRKNFLPGIVWSLTLWFILGGIVLLADPDIFGVIILFFVVLFFAFLFSFSLILAGTRRGLIAAAALTLFLVLRYFGVGNLLNGLLIAGAALASEIYFWYSGEQK